MTTPILAAIIIAVLVGYDFYLLLDKVPNNTWSEVLRAWGTRTLLVPWCWGGLGGHFFHFFSKGKPIIDQPGNIALLVWLSALVALSSVVLTKFGADPTYYMYGAFLTGSVVWMLLWPV
jgi:hypothetical protein